MKIRTFVCIFIIFFGLSGPSILFCANNNDQKTNSTATQNELKKKPLLHFNAIELSGVGDLYITQSTEENFTVEAPDDILPLVVVYVKEGILYIDLKDSSKHTDAKINYYLNVKNIKSINAYSSSVIHIKDRLETDELTLSVANLGEANVYLSVKKLIAKIDGGGKIVAKGSAEVQSISIKGAGEFNAAHLSGKSAALDINGSGAAKLRVTDNLTVSGTGDGKIQYCGQPNVVRQITGKVSIEPLTENECS